MGLAVFLGYLGGHNFYRGQLLQGVGHVFLCFMGVAILIGSHTSFGTIAGCGLLLVDCLWAVAELFWIATSKDGTLL